MNNVRSVMSGPLSGTSTYNLIVNGDWGPRQIKNLMRQLELQMTFLAEDEAALQSRAER